MIIRKASKGEIPGLLKLNEAAVPHVNSISEEQINWFLEHSNFFLVAEQEGSIGGFLIVLGPGLAYESSNYHFFNNNYKNFDYIDRIVVEEGFRGKGMGTALYEYLFAHTRAGAITCEVNLDPPNPGSLAFHKKMEFSEIARQYVQGGKKVSFMIRRL